jgi:hypothetical protein
MRCRNRLRPWKRRERAIDEGSTGGARAGGRPIEAVQTASICAAVVQAR